jgi:hypothetical protein
VQRLFVEMYKYKQKWNAITGFPNLSIVDVDGLHWTPLDDPHAISEGLASWLATLKQS